MVNRTQTLVIGFFLVVLVSVLAIRFAAPKVYDQALRLPSGDRRSQIIFLAALVTFIVLLAGVVQFVIGLALVAGFRRAGVWGAS
jgi:hypothetical protein